MGADVRLCICTNNYIGGCTKSKLAVCVYTNTSNAIKIDGFAHTQNVFFVSQSRPLFLDVTLGVARKWDGSLHVFTAVKYLLFASVYTFRVCG